ncbi:alpha/beta hydrolase [Candidatus Chloroploca asiatica]|uniref:Alpha/beta hydrolase n=2 Tax=Candidatus Chloroploca asiatica TaxID=1506545 RepID=A0A2H3L434_9CHLR|nr:alpha/beta hydrolase [Candidatus Chloroploca asiatica]
MHRFNVQKAKSVMWTVIVIMVAASLVLLSLLLAWSPGRPQPFLDAHGQPLADSLAEKIHVDINGVEQGMFIKSKHIGHPVLLFVHGGPGMPEYWLTQRYPTDLEAHFTVVWWEQRGAGLSYSPDIPPETMTAEQFVADTLEVTRYLINRFGQEKIYLMGHSWGSYLGIQAVAEAPELYHAYLGMGQVSYQLQAEQLAYAYALAQYNTNGNQRMVRRLEAAPPTMTVPLPTAYEALRDEYMHGIGIGTTRDMTSVITGIFLPSWQFREYTLREKVNLWRGKVYSRSRTFSLWDTMQATDLTQQVTELAIPVYFFHGTYDYTCAYPLARAYFDELKAPLKGFYTFENSAHSPIFEEPDKALKILLEDVLKGATTLADEEER